MHAPFAQSEKRRLEANSSSSNTSRSAVLDALDISEPMFLRGLLDRILTMPDLAGISRTKMKPTVATESQALASEDSYILQRTKRKRPPSDSYEETDFLSNERSSSSSRYVRSYTYESIQVCTPPPNKYASEYTIADKKRARTFKNIVVEDNDMSPSYRRYDGNIEIDADEVRDSGFSEVTKDVHGHIRSSPWSSQDHRSSPYSTSLKRSSSNYMPYSNLDSEEIVNWNEGHACLPTSIVFRSLKDGPAKRSMRMSTYPVEEPTVYGTLFEQADPWDAIGHILGLSNTKPSKGLEVINQLSELSGIGKTGASAGAHSVVIEMEERAEDLMSAGADEMHQVQFRSLIERPLIDLEEKQVSSRCDSIEEFEEEPGNTFCQSPQLSSLQKDVQEMAQGSDDDLEYLLGDKVLFPPTLSSPQDILEAVKSPDSIETRVDECDSIKRGLTEEAIWNGEYKSILDIPELQELDGLFIGPSLFDGLDEEEDEDE